MPLSHIAYGAVLAAAVLRDAEAPLSHIAYAPIAYGAGLDAAELLDADGLEAGAEDRPARLSTVPFSFHF